MSDEIWKKPASRKLRRVLGRKSWDLAKGTARGAANASSWSGEKLWKHRRGIGGVAAGAVKAGADAAVDSSSHIAYKRRVHRKAAKLEELADRQKNLTARFHDRVLVSDASRKTVLDTVAIGARPFTPTCAAAKFPKRFSGPMRGPTQIWRRKSISSTAFVNSRAWS
jgi:hypothetical protein